MQLTGNAPRDAAVSAALVADTREITWQTLFDWNNNGGFSNAWSDLSGALVSVDGDQSWTTALPQDVTGVTGYSTGICTLTFAGTRSGTDLFTVFQLLAEYNSASPLYRLQRVGIPVQINCTVTHGGPFGSTQVNKLTGVIHSVSPRRSDRTVTIVVWDATSTLNQPLTLPRWATDGSVRTAHNANNALTTTGTVVNGRFTTDTDWSINAAGVVDLILRNNGYYTAPAPVSGAMGNCMLSVPFSGTHLPDIGFGFIDYSMNGNSGYGTSLVSKEGPLWAPGQYGNAYNGNPAWAFTPNYQCNQVAFPGTFLPVGGTSFAMGMWVLPDGVPGPPRQPIFTKIKLWFTPNTPTSTQDDSMVLIVNHDGSTQVQLSGEGGYFVTGSGPNLTTGIWNYIAVAVTFTLTAASFTFFVNGAQQGTSAHTVYPVPVTQYSGTPPNEGNQVLGLNSQVQVVADLSIQSVQVWTYTGLPVQAVNWPQAAPGNSNAIDLALNNLTFLPDLINADPWQTIKDIAAAEFAVVYTDEQANWRFKSRTTLRSFLSRPVDQVITLDSLQELELLTVKDGVRNYFSFSATSGAQWLQPVWTAPAAGFLSIPPGPSYAIPLSNPDASWINPSVSGLVTATSPDAFISTLVSGWYAVETDAANAQFNPATGVAPTTNFGGLFWEVRSDPLGRSGTLLLQNVGSHVLQFTTKPAVGANGTPSFIIGGYQILPDPPMVGSVQDTASQHSYGFQIFALPASDWLQFPVTAIAVCKSLLLGTHAPVPVAQQPITTLGDPRRQLGDRVELQDPGQSGSRLLANLVGIRWSWSPANGYIDSLTVQLAAAPGGWVLGDPDFSTLGSTTNLV